MKIKTSNKISQSIGFNILNALILSLVAPMIVILLTIIFRLKTYTPTLNEWKEDYSYSALFLFILYFIWAVLNIIFYDATVNYLHKHKKKYRILIKICVQACIGIIACLLYPFKASFHAISIHNYRLSFASISLFLIECALFIYLHYLFLERNKM